MMVAAVALVGILTFGGLVWPFEAASRVVRIGVLSGASASRAKRNIDAFREGLQELGYVEGKNLILEYRHGNEEPERLPALAADLVSKKVDVILVTGTRPIAAAREATRTIPIVAGGAGDLVGTKLVTSLARPGGNITGFTRMATEVGAKRIELLRQAVSGDSRIAVIWSTDQDQDELKDVESAGLRSGSQVQPVPLRDPGEFESAYESMVSKRANALIILHSGFTLFHRKELLALALKHRLPSMCELPRWAESGCLMSYGPDLRDLFRRAAKYVDKILPGASPADLSVQRPIKFNLVINMETAQRLGITIPSSVLYRADVLIK